MKIERGLKVRLIYRNADQVCYVGDIFTTTISNRKLIQFRLHKDKSLSIESKIFKDKRNILELWEKKDIIAI